MVYTFLYIILLPNKVYFSVLLSQILVLYIFRTPDELLHCAIFCTWRL
jgi:hypothetical protein